VYTKKPDLKMTGTHFFSGFFNLFLKMISIYKNVYEKISSSSLDINKYFNNIKEGFWQDSVLAYRNGKIKKELLPAVTASGIFSKERKADKIDKHSGIIVMDFDAKENNDIISKREEIYADNFLYAAHISVGGAGLALYFKIDGKKHLESFLALEKYLANKYHIIADQACKDVTRLRFISYDPELYLNPNAPTWKEFINKKLIKPQNYQPVYCKNDIEYIIQQINHYQIDITNDYHNWIKIGFALANEYGEAGRSYFHSISKNHINYDYQKTEKKYDSLVKSKGAEGYTISTLFWLAKQNNIKIKTPQTEKIQRVATIRKKEIGKNGGFENIQKATESTIKYLSDVENINIEDAKEITTMVMQSNSEEAADSSDIEIIVEYIKQQGLRYNEITQRTELKNEDLTDRLENSIFLNCKAIFPKIKFSKDLISSIINSDRVESYNPFFEFIEKYKHIKTNNLILDLLDCFYLKYDEDYSAHIGKFIEKWLISIMASVHGTYSLLTLVLIGEQGTNKTNFFRYLLPDELSKYYAESKLDREKDDEILMSQKLIIVDDEFGGKSKKEAGKFKELSSKQIITARKSYGKYNEDYRRLAVLGGTSNDEDIINDTTGNRRIIPVSVKYFDFEKYKKIDKTALFIEIYKKWKKIGNEWFLTTKEIEVLNDISNRFSEISIEEEIILKCFRKPEEGERPDFFTATDMLNFCEGLLNKQRLYHKTFGKILKKIGFEKISKKGRGYGYQAIKII
jgi:predicted P-loop ATPase